MPKIELFHIVGPNYGMGKEWRHLAEVGPKHVCMTVGWPPPYMMIIVMIYKENLINVAKFTFFLDKVSPYINFHQEKARTASWMS